MKIEDSLKSVSLEEINEIESKYGIVIPSEYKVFLLDYNGGYVSTNDFTLPNGTSVLFNSFLGVKYGDLTLEETYQDLQVLEETVSTKLFIFGFDPFGNCFCIDRESNEVVFWDHEDGDSELVCESFNYFLNGVLSFQD